MRIESKTEVIFAQAVALSQNGRLKNTIYVGEGNIFILNMDNTIILRFDCPQSFPQPFAFFANDYEGSELEVVAGGKIKFSTHDNVYQREKVCPAPKMLYSGVKNIWDVHMVPGIVRDKKLVFSSAILPLLEEGLSHVEFSQGPVVTQRDIYSGARIEIKEKKPEGSFMEDLLGDSVEFETFGVRTVDFQALFTFTDALSMGLQPGKPWVYLQAASQFEGILSRCVYDELGKLGVG